MKSLTITVFLFSSLFIGSVAYSATDDNTPSAPDTPAANGGKNNPVLNLKHDRRISPKAIDARKKPRMIKQEAAPIHGSSTQGQPADPSQTKHAKHIRPNNLSTQRKKAPKIAPEPKHGVVVPKEKTKSVH